MPSGATVAALNWPSRVQRRAPVWVRQAMRWWLTFSQTRKNSPSGEVASILAPPTVSHMFRPVSLGVVWPRGLNETTRSSKGELRKSGSQSSRTRIREAEGSGDWNSSIMASLQRVMISPTIRIITSSNTALRGRSHLGHGMLAVSPFQFVGTFKWVIVYLQGRFPNEKHRADARGVGRLPGGRRRQAAGRTPNAWRVPYRGACSGGRLLPVDRGGGAFYGSAGKKRKHAPKVLRGFLLSIWRIPF